MHWNARTHYSRSMMVYIEQPFRRFKSLRPKNRLIDLCVTPAQVFNGFIAAFMPKGLTTTKACEAIQSTLARVCAILATPLHIGGRENASIQPKREPAFFGQLDSWAVGQLNSWTVAQFGQLDSWTLRHIEKNITETFCGEFRIIEDLSSGEII